MPVPHCMTRGFARASPNSSHRFGTAGQTHLIWRDLSVRVSVRVRFSPLSRTRTLSLTRLSPCRISVSARLFGRFIAKCEELDVFALFGTSPYRCRPHPPWRAGIKPRHPCFFCKGTLRLRAAPLVRSTDPSANKDSLPVRARWLVRGRCARSHSDCS